VIAAKRGTGFIREDLEIETETEDCQSGGRHRDIISQAGESAVVLDELAVTGRIKIGEGV
jgi:hypothetical protein